MKRIQCCLLSLLLLFLFSMSGCGQSYNNDPRLFLPEDLYEYEDQLHNGKNDRSVVLDSLNQKLNGRHIVSVGMMAEQRQQYGNDLYCVCDSVKYSPEGVVGNLNMEVRIVPKSFSDDAKPDMIKNRIYIIQGDVSGVEYSYEDETSIYTVSVENAVLSVKRAGDMLNTRNTAIPLTIERILGNYLYYNQILNGGKAYLTWFGGKTVDFEDPAEPIRTRYADCYVELEGVFTYDDEHDKLVCSGEVLRGGNFDSLVSGESQLYVYIPLDGEEGDKWSTVQDGDTLHVTGIINGFVMQKDTTSSLINKENYNVILTSVEYDKVNAK